MYSDKIPQDDSTDDTLPCSGYTGYSSCVAETITRGDYYVSEQIITGLYQS